MLPYCRLLCCWMFPHSYLVWSLCFAVFNCPTGWYAVAVQVSSFAFLSANFSVQSEILWINICFSALFFLLFSFSKKKRTKENSTSEIFILGISVIHDRFLLQASQQLVSIYYLSDNMDNIAKTIFSSINVRRSIWLYRKSCFSWFTVIWSLNFRLC